MKIYDSQKSGRAWGIAVTMLLCAALALGGVSYAAASETVIVLDGSTGEAKNYDLAVFGREYIDTAGRVLALSSDAMKIIAPGLCGEHMVRIRNENAFTVEYEIVVDTSSQSEVKVNLPIEVRVTAGLESVKQWQRLGDTVSEKISGTLDAGQEMSFYYQWRWDDSDDALDTCLAHEVPELTIKAQASISAVQKTVRRSGSSSGSGSSGGSGVRWDTAARGGGPGVVTDAEAAGVSSADGAGNAGSAAGGTAAGADAADGSKTAKGDAATDITRPDIAGYSDALVPYAAPQSPAVVSVGSWTQIPAQTVVTADMTGGVQQGTTGGPTVGWIFTATDGTRPAGGWVYTTSMYAQGLHDASMGVTAGTAAGTGTQTGTQTGLQTEDGTAAGTPTAGWYYFTSDGRLAVGWIRMPDTGHWYYTQEDAGVRLGMLHTGWLYEKRDGRWYYLAPDSGIMCDGWRRIDDCWYCFTRREDADDHEWRMEQTSGGYMTWNYYGRRAHSYGSMYIREYTPDGYFVDSEGRWVQGA